MKIAFTLSLLAASAAALGLTTGSSTLSPRDAGEIVSVVSPQEPATRAPIEFDWPSLAPVATPTFHGAPPYEKSRRAIADERRRVLNRPLGE